MIALRRWEPFRGLMSLQSELDRAFDEFFGQSVMKSDGVRAPTLDVSETAEEVIVKAELPGVDKKDVQVEVLPESLSLKERTYHRRERVWRHYERLIPLPSEVITDKVKAVMKDGVLEIRMPKTEPSKETASKKVAIE